MIEKPKTSANGWTPHGFDGYRNHYPNTGWTPVDIDRDLSERFISYWETDAVPVQNSARTVVLSPGLFSEFLPGCFSAAKKTLSSAGFRVIRTRARSRFSIREQAERLAAGLRQDLGNEERFIWCGHSKGSIELLWALEQTQALRALCAAAIVVQPAAGVSPVVNRWQNAPKTIFERAGGALISTPPVRAGVRDISKDRDDVVSKWLEEFSPVTPTLCVATWSIKPTSWVDSYHRTLNEIAPGHAHDGQFLMTDQRLPGTSLVCLPELDHAQPVFGGNQLDTERLWRALIHVGQELGDSE